MFIYLEGCSTVTRPSQVDEPDLRTAFVELTVVFINQKPPGRKCGRGDDGVGPVGGRRKEVKQSQW